MNLVLLTHPAFLGSHSQAHFARMLAEAYRQRGHIVALRQPEPLVHRWVPTGRLSKWAGYVDQYLLFPARLRSWLRQDPPDTVYVLCDQALGPWVPCLAHRPHVVHCHDLLALRSALGEVPENPTAFTGRVYQRYIRWGFRRARHFISISQRSRDELHHHGGVQPVTSEVVYNGLNHPYRPVPPEQARALLLQAGLPVDGRGCVLHIGGGQWYKNTVGVVSLYARYADAAVSRGARPLPLWMVSPAPDPLVRSAMAGVPPEGEVRFFSGLSAEVIEALYAYAEVLLFPSLAEGFGWPIAEALACGCPVLTTDDAPMTEVGGDAAVYLPRLRPSDDMSTWAGHGAQALLQVLARSPQERELCAAAGRAWAARFDPAAAIDRYLVVYEQVLALEQGRQARGAFA